MKTKTKPPTLDTIRDDVKKALKRQKRTQRSVAEEMGITHIHLNNFLCGRSSLQIETMMDLLYVLGLRLVVMRIPK